MSSDSELPPTLPGELQEEIRSVARLPADERRAREAELIARHPDLADQIRALVCLEGFAPASDESLPEFIGPYRVLEALGEGGMGSVYLAEQSEPIHRRVAVKVIRVGMDSSQVLARFEAERQALAVMNHDNVARIYDAGRTENGQPYFVMEYVPGQILTDYCDEKQLDLHERLKLFRQICAGVHHAHQKGVIHRDLKPSNVIVSDQQGTAVPKIIDFGLARATDPDEAGVSLLTQTGMLLGTLHYMSPEQASMGATDIDTRTDIYSLGVILYEMLVGQLPFFGHDVPMGLLGLQRAIQETEPSKPSAKVASLGASCQPIADCRRLTPSLLARRLRGDLDWIVMMAMAKDPDRRYASAHEFSTDIGRFLEFAPVVAGPPSTAYRMRKLARRYRGLLAAAAVVLLTATAGSIGIFVEYRRAEANASEAGQRAVEATAARAVTHVRAARLAAERGRWAEAIENYDLAEKSGHADRIELTIGRVLAYSGGLNDARALEELHSLNDVADLGTHESKVLLLRASMLANRLEDPFDKLDLVRTALDSGTLAPADQAYARYLLAETMVEARRHLEVGLQHDRHNRMVNCAHLIVMLAMGKRREIRETVSLYRALYPKDPIGILTEIVTLALHGDRDAARALSESVRDSLPPSFRTITDLGIEVAPFATKIDEIWLGKIVNPRDMSGMWTLMKAQATLMPRLWKFGSSKARQDESKTGIPISVPFPPALLAGFKAMVPIFTLPLKAMLFGRSKATLKRMDDAVDEALRRTGQAHFYFLKASSRLRAGDFDEAEALLLQALEAPAPLMECWRSSLYLLVHVRVQLYERAKDQKLESVSAIREGIRATIREILARHRSTAAHYEYLAGHALSVGAMNLASSITARWCEESPNDLEAALMESRIAVERGAYALATQRTGEILRAHPDNQRAILLRDRALAKLRAIAAPRSATRRADSIQPASSDKPPAKK